MTPNVGYIFGFSVGSGGVLTPLAGSPFSAGTPAFRHRQRCRQASLFTSPTTPRTMCSDYSVASGLLTPLAGNPFPAGNAPSAIVVDPSFRFAYVANSTDSTVTAYSISSGALTRLLGTTTTGLQPVAIGIDPSTNHFLYTANFLGNNVTGFELSQTAGTLLDAQYSPFPSNNQPTAVAAIPHDGTGSGVHAVKSLQIEPAPETEQVATPRTGLLQYLRGNLNEFSWG